MLTVSLDQVCSSLRVEAEKIAAALQCRVRSPLEELLTYAPFSQLEEADGKVMPAVLLLMHRYYGFRRATEFKASEKANPFYIVGLTKSGNPRLLMVPAVFNTSFGVSGEVQDSGSFCSFASGYTSVVGVYALSRKGRLQSNGSGPAAPHKA